MSICICCQELLTIAEVKGPAQAKFERGTLKEEWTKQLGPPARTPSAPPISDGDIGTDEGGAKVGEKLWYAFSEMRPWTRNEKMGYAGIAVAVLVGLNVFFVPEVRYFFGLDRRPSSAPQSQQTSSLPSLPAPVAPQSKEPSALHGEAADSVVELRQRHQVTRMRETESGETLSEVPVGSFGFVIAEFFTTSWSSSPDPEKMPLKSRGSSWDLEIHKLADGHSEIVAYVGPETLERIRHGLGKGEKLTIYTDARKEASNLIAMPIARIECERSRSLKPDQMHDIDALDCRAK